MNDIFKDMQANVGCEYISDLPSYKRKVWHCRHLATFHPAYRTTLTMKPTGEIWIWAVALLKQAEVCARYHINAGRSATSIVATDSVFLF